MFKRASHNEKIQLFSLVHEIWPHANRLEDHLTERLNSIQHIRAEWFVILKDNQVLAGLGRYPLNFVDSEKNVFKAMAIGAIYTKKEYRNKGIATQLIEQTHSVSKKENIGLSILYSDIDPNYYAKFGYEIIPTKLSEIKVGHTKYLDNIFIKETSCLESRTNIYSQYCKNFDSFFLRTEDYWEWSNLRFKDAKHFNCYIDKELCGYLTIGNYEGKLQVLDCAFLKKTHFKLLHSFIIKAMVAINHSSCFSWERHLSFETKNIIKHKRQKEIPMFLKLNKKIKISNDKDLLLSPMDHV